MKETNKDSLWAMSHIAAIILLGGLSLYSVITVQRVTAALEAQQKNQTVSTSESSGASATAVDMEAAIAAGIARHIAAQKQREADQKFEKYALAQDQVPDGKHIYGDLTARFTLVTFSDMECPYCKRFHDTPKQIVDASKGNVNWQFVHLPLDFHNPAAFDQAHAAECVAESHGNRAFFTFLDEVFKHSGGNGQGVANIGALVDGLNIPVDVFNDCMQSGKFGDKVRSHTQQAAKQGINGTPATFVVDNQTGKSLLVSGAQPAGAFMGVISRMVAGTNTESNQSESDKTDG